MNSNVINNIINNFFKILNLPQLAYFFFGHLVKLYKLYSNNLNFSKIFIFKNIYFYINNNEFFLLNSITNFNLVNYNILFTNNINFLTLILVIILALGFVLFLFLQAKLLNISFYPNSTFDSEKYSPYECGFAPFRTERAQFDIKFYLVALLFLVFDVELMFLLPYCISYYYLGVLGYLIFIIFFSLLIVGFLVEWAVGMLTWKGEENSPLNKYKIENHKNDFLIKAINYVEYLDKYFNHLDKLGWSKQYFKYINMSKFLFLRKFKKRRPFHSKYFLNIPKNENYERQLKFLNLKNPLYFYIDKKLFYGGSTYTVIAYYMYVEKKQKQERIERLFTIAYGDVFTEWLKTCTPEQRDFVL